MGVNQDFEVLFAEYYEALHNYALSILKDEQDGEDVVQNVFEAVWSKGLETIDEPKRYLIRAVKFGCIDLIRKRKKRGSVSDPDSILNSLTEETDVANQIDQELLHKITFLVADLPEKTREVFLMSRQGGYTYREIAEMLQISVKTVENQMARALRHLRTGLADF